MAILGIEGTAHTLGVGIVREEPGQPGRCQVLANQRDMIQPEEGGIIPREAAEHHAEIGPGLVQAALDEAGLTPGDITGVAYSQGPGLGPCLRVAATLARALSLRLDVPLAGVNHCVAHLEIGRGLTDAKDPVLLYASGANTQVIAFVRGRYRVFGETLDIGIGNALDKFARDNDLPFPGGPKIEQAAAASSQTFHELPYTVKGMDQCFAGTIIKAQRFVDEGVPFGDVCYSLQETAFASLCEVAERALAHTGKTELVLGGGVACNSRLQEMARQMVEARGGAYYCPPRPVLVDNGTMIAWLGHLKLNAGVNTELVDSGVRPHERTDHVEALWRRTA
ncbi:MAG: bifunctional N(6)-L-threonylcarbamoyladenine synthase/serine/threonine protein kinase [Thermoplasmatota archaeon]